MEKGERRKTVDKGPPGSLEEASTMSLVGKGATETRGKQKLDSAQYFWNMDEPIQMVGWKFREIEFAWSNSVYKFDPSILDSDRHENTRNF